MNKTYIHYGANRFCIDKFKEIKNDYEFTKPQAQSGLWASDINAHYGWRDWCITNNFETERLKKSFTFTLINCANVLTIDSIEALKKLPIKETSYPWTCLDFERLKDEGVDAIEVNISKCRELYFELYGWDCDSILIMNKDIILPDLWIEEQRKAKEKQNGKIKS